MSWDQGTRGVATGWAPDSASLHGVRGGQQQRDSLGLVGNKRVYVYVCAYLHMMMIMTVFSPRAGPVDDIQFFFKCHRTRSWHMR